MKYKITKEHREAINIAFKTPQAKLNKSAASKEMWKSEEYRAKLGAVRANPEFVKMMWEKTRKPCTVDGIRIFESYNELKLALGQGKQGTRSPHLTYLNKDNITKANNE